MAHSTPVIIPKLRLSNNYLPRKDQEKNQGTPAQTLDLSPSPWEQLSSLSQNKVLKIMKEQVKSKYRWNEHPKNIFFSHQAINRNGLFSHNPDTEEAVSTEQLWMTALQSTQVKRGFY